MSAADDLLYRIAFSSFRTLRPSLAEVILDRCGSEQEFFTLSESALSSMMGFRNKLFSERQRAEALTAARKELRFIEENAIRTFYFRDPDYPERLIQCDDAPLMLFGLGDCDFASSRVISIVGTRHATPYGIDFVDKFVHDIAELMTEKPVIVSGLAYGIDIAAHRASLDNGLPTAAILAHGLNTIYPGAHRSTAAEIARHGGILMTDYTCSDAIHKGNFLARNRIVAGLCDALIVVESADKGGALVTARIASGYSRDVFALPGRITDRYSAGCNALIADQIAGVITSASDFIDRMQWPKINSQPTLPLQTDTLQPEEKMIVDLLSRRGDLSFAELTANINIPTPRLMSTLVDLEFRSILRQIPGGLYRLKS